VTAAIRREIKRRAAIELIIGHVKAAHRIDRDYLNGRANTVLTASPLPATQLQPPPALLERLSRALIAALTQLPAVARSACNISTQLAHSGRGFADCARRQLSSSWTMTW